MTRTQLLLTLFSTGFLFFTPDLRAQSTPEGERMYRQGVAAEQSGDMKAAVELYLASSKAGNPVADQKLGQLYDKGAGSALPRDLQESIAHYQNARKAGLDIKGPTDRAPNPANVK